LAGCANDPNERERCRDRSGSDEQGKGGFPHLPALRQDARPTQPDGEKGREHRARPPPAHLRYDEFDIGKTLILRYNVGLAERSNHA
jgi:hypothetical protein